MREILFKAKRTDNGEWVEGNLITNEKDPSSAYIGYLFDVRNGMIEDFDIVEVIPDTVCQYTGLTDGNGRKIWEGDILSSNKNKDALVQVVFGEFFVINAWTLEKIDKVIGWHYEVIPTDVWSRCEPFNISMPLTERSSSWCEFEVVGNVFDNPELLMKQEG